MKMHSTNYYSTLIEISEDCPEDSGVIPPIKEGQKTVAALQFEIINKNPYKYTSDDVLFQVFAIRNDLSKAEYKSARQLYFSKGQPCFRASPLTKRYGWGVHSNIEGKIALYGCETKMYREMINDKSFKKIKAMKTNK